MTGGRNAESCEERSSPFLNKIFSQSWKQQQLCSL